MHILTSEDILTNMSNPLVHGGFMLQLTTPISNELSSPLNFLVKNYANIIATQTKLVKQIYITGHSLGGAFALIMATILQLEVCYSRLLNNPNSPIVYKVRPRSDIVYDPVLKQIFDEDEHVYPPEIDMLGRIRCITFAEPMCGNKSFKTLVDFLKETTEFEHYSFYYGYDPIPLTPLRSSKLNYEFVDHRSNVMNMETLTVEKDGVNMKFKDLWLYLMYGAQHHMLYMYRDAIDLHEERFKESLEHYIITEKKFKAKNKFGFNNIMKTSKLAYQTPELFTSFPITLKDKWADIQYAANLVTS